MSLWQKQQIYINPDNIAQETYGDWNSPDAILKAAQEATVLRITNRYLNGGHEVPISKICSRYHKFRINAAAILPIVDRAYLYDNSVENETPRLICRFVDGKIFKNYTDTYPNWIKGML